MAFGVSPFQSAASQASAVISTKLWLAIIIYIMDKFWIKRVFPPKLFWKFPFFCYQEVLVTYHLETSHGEWKLSCQSIYAWHVLVFLDIDIIWSSPFAIITFMIYYHCMWCYYHCIEHIMSMIIKENIFFTITIHVTFLMIALIKRLCFVGYKPSWSWGSRWVDCQVLRGEARRGCQYQAVADLTESKAGQQFAPKWWRSYCRRLQRLPSWNE